MFLTSWGGRVVVHDALTDETQEYFTWTEIPDNVNFGVDLEEVQIDREDIIDCKAHVWANINRVNNFDGGLQK